MPKQQLKWKYLRQQDRRKAIASDRGNTKWKIGEWNSVKGKVQTCGNGLHCSDGILQAFSYVQGEVLAQVEVRGESSVNDDKSAWREMRIVTAYRWTKEDSAAFAIYAAEQVISIYEEQYPDDSRPRDAIKAAKAYLKDPSKKNQDATTDAANAAYAATDAAYSAVRVASVASAAYAASAASAASAAYATTDAAYSAVRVAYATYATTDAAALREKLERWFKRRVKQLEQIK